MTYVITDACIKARMCVGVCLVECIYDAGDHFIINPEECIDCTMCDAACPSKRPARSSPRRKPRPKRPGS